MQAWVVDDPGPVDTGPLRRVERPLPEPGPGQVRVRVRCCGVCRTDLHLAEGDLPPRRPGVVPGHEVVGVVDALGPGRARFSIGERIGVAWLGRTDGTCRFCRRGDENLCLAPTFTGWDVDGGYADACLVDEAFAYRLPEALPDEQAAPLLCAGIIGYRALRSPTCPPGGRLGIYGFGGSAHLTAQVALAQGMRVHVLTRGEHNRRLAAELGVDSVGRRRRHPAGAAGRGDPVRAGRGAGAGRAARAGPRAPPWPWPASGCPTSRALGYADELFQERRLRSVTANTRQDGEEFLRLADRLGVRATTVGVPDGRGAARPGRPGARPLRGRRRPAQLIRSAARRRRRRPQRLGHRVGQQHRRDGRGGDGEPRAAAAAPWPSRSATGGRKQQREQDEELDADRRRPAAGCRASPSDQAGRLVLRQAKALANWPRTTAVNAAPDAVARCRRRTRLRRSDQPAAGSTARNAAIATTASAGPSTPKARRSSRRVDEPPPRRRAVRARAGRGFGAQGQGRQQVGADVEAEDLQHAQGERDGRRR